MSEGLKHDLVGAGRFAGWGRGPGFERAVGSRGWRQGVRAGGQVMRIFTSDRGDTGVLFGEEKTQPKYHYSNSSTSKIEILLKLHFTLTNTADEQNNFYKLAINNNLINDNSSECRHRCA